MSTERLTTTPEIPFHPILRDIRQRVQGAIDTRLVLGPENKPTNLERLGRDLFGLPTSDVRSEQLLPSGSEKFRKVYGNSFTLVSLLSSKNTDELSEKNFIVSKEDPPKSLPPRANYAVVNFTVANPDFNLTYILNSSATFELNIQFGENYRTQIMEYRSGEASVTRGMTDEEADLIIFYTDLFISSEQKS